MAFCALNGPLCTSQRKWFDSEEKLVEGIAHLALDPILPVEFLVTEGTKVTFNMIVASLDEGVPTDATRTLLTIGSVSSELDKELWRFALSNDNVALILALVLQTRHGICP